MNDLPSQDLLDDMAANAGPYIRLRQAIHSHPEIGFQEFHTSDLVAEELTALGYQVERGLGGTGVVGRLQRGSSTRSIGLRADMDALPIHEATDLPHGSKVPGMMHACGHDGHTAMLLAAARRIAHSDNFDGTVNLIFQPAEEGLGGAVRMMDDGLFDKYPCDAIFAMHNMPGYPQGHLMFRDGSMMASSDYATIKLTGRGGHGAIPHKAADPIVAAASLIMALQTIVSRNIDPQQAAVVTVGAIHAGEANNVIPGEAILQLTIRALDREVRELLKQRLIEVTHAQAASFGVQADVDYRQGYAVLVNTRAETDIARQVAVDLIGADKVVLQGPAVTGSEDFAFMLERRPGCYLFIGNGDSSADGPCHNMVHNPGYDFNDRNIAVGSAYWVKLVERYLAVQA